MIVTDIVALDKKRSKIYLDEEFAFVLYKGELRSYKIIVNEILSDTYYQEIMTEVLPKRAKLRAMNLLTKRAYTEGKLRRKLQDGLYPEEIIEDALEYVKSFGYVDDLEYAKEYITYNSVGMNKQQIEQKLLQRELSKDVIAKAFEAFYENEGVIDEIEQINRILEKKHYDKELMSPQKQQQIKSMLYRKGFHSDNILKAMTAFT